MQSALHDEQLQPFAELVAGFRKKACGLEAQRGMKCFRGCVDAADAGDHGVAAFCAALEYEFSKEESADAVTDAIGADVDRVFYGEAVAFAGPEL